MDLRFLRGEGAQASVLPKMSTSLQKFCLHEEILQEECSLLTGSYTLQEEHSFLTGSYTLQEELSFLTGSYTLEAEHSFLTGSYTLQEEN